MPQTRVDEEFEHSVTYEDTVKHWVLYTLDAIESESDPETKPDAVEDAANTARQAGVYPEEIYEYAAGEDSIVFRNKREIQATLSDMARDGKSWEDGSRPVNRRTEATTWEGVDVEYRYRLNDFGRKVLLDLGVPQRLPNRRDFDEVDRGLGVKPAHQPGWWQDEYDLFSDEWDIRENDWIQADVENVYYKDEGDMAFAEDRGYKHIGTKLAEAFPDVTFVLTIGPYRQHDLMYAIRDPFRQVVQIDIYSPMSLHRRNDEITANFEALVTDLAKGLANVREEYDD